MKPTVCSFDQVQAGSAGSASRSAATSPDEASSKAVRASAYDVGDGPVSGRSSGFLGRFPTTQAHWACVSARWFARSRAVQAGHVGTGAAGSASASTSRKRADSDSMADRYWEALNRLMERR